MFSYSSSERGKAERARNAEESVLPTGALYGLGSLATSASLTEYAQVPHRWGGQIAHEFVRPGESDQPHFDR